MNTQIYQEAGEWLITFRTNSTTPNGRAEFNSWLRKSPEHVQAYLELSAVWEQSARLDPDHERSSEALISRARNAESIVPFDSASKPSAQLRRGEGELRPPILRVRSLALAATLVVAAFAAWFGLLRGSYSTQIGEQRSITLADGSVIELNARSTVRVRFSDQERRVDLLAGEALFRVSRDTTRPFVVHGGGTRVQALGTAFDVYLKSSRMIVSVVEGRIAVLPSAGTSSGDSPAPHAQRAHSLPSAIGKGADFRKGADSPGDVTVGDLPPRGEFILEAGEQLVVMAADVRKTSRPDVAAATAWTQHRLVFNFAPLSDVVDEFNRYNTRQIEIETPELRGYSVVGVFSSTDPDALLMFLAAQPGVAVDRRTDKVIIRRR